MLADIITPRLDTHTQLLGCQSASLLLELCSLYSGMLGSLTLLEPGKLMIGCQNTFLIFPVNPITQATSPFGACTNGTAVGQASTIIGAVNNHATQLAEVIYDNTPQPALHPKSYTVGCSIDIEPSIDFQPVSFSRLDGDTNFVWSQGVPFTVQSNGDSCKSNSEKGPIDLGDGWWHTLWNVAAKCRYGDISPITCSPFNKYCYPREDALVLVSGIVLSSF